MDFYTRAARVLLVVVGVLTLLPIIAGLAIISLALNERFNMERFLAIVGALGGPDGPLDSDRASVEIAPP